MQDAQLPLYVAVVGATATGKSALALRVAAATNSEIVSCDSLQVYRDFNIGTAKPTAAERGTVPHHMIDIATHQDHFDAAVYARTARVAFAQIIAKQKTPLLVGGTGLYLRSFWGDNFDFDLPKNESLRTALGLKTGDELYTLLKTLDPKRAEQLHPNDKFRLVRAIEIKSTPRLALTRRPPAQTHWRRKAFVIYINPDKEQLRRRIRARVAQMLQRDLVGEVQGLIKNGCPETAKPMQSIGYRQVVEFLNDRIAANQLEEQIFVATCQYAKRQRTWFKKVGVDLELRDFGDEVNDKKVIEKLNLRKISNEFSH